MCQYGDEHTSNVLVSFKFDNFSSRAPESTVGGRILSAMPFPKILLNFVHSCPAPIAQKMRKIRWKPCLGKKGERLTKTDKGCLGSQIWMNFWKNSKRPML